MLCFCCGNHFLAMEEIIAWRDRYTVYVPRSSPTLKATVEDQSWRLERRSQPETPPTERLAPVTQRKRMELNTITTIAFTAHSGLGPSIFLQTKQNKSKMEEILLVSLKNNAENWLINTLVQVLIISILEKMKGEMRGTYIPMARNWASKWDNAERREKESRVGECEGMAMIVIHERVFSFFPPFANRERMRMRNRKRGFTLFCCSWEG